MISKGKWRVDERNKDAVENEAGRTVAIAYATTDTARLSEMHANARAISALPELIGLAQEVLNVADMLHADGQTEIVTLAKAALAKAGVE